MPLHLYHKLQPINRGNCVTRGTESGMLEIPRARTKHGQYAYSHRGPLQWNITSPIFKAAMNKVQLKNLLKTSWYTVDNNWVPPSVYPGFQSYPSMTTLSSPTTTIPPPSKDHHIRWYDVMSYRDLLKATNSNFLQLPPYPHKSTLMSRWHVTAICLSFFLYILTTVLLNVIVIYVPCVMMCRIRILAVAIHLAHYVSICQGWISTYQLQCEFGELFLSVPAYVWICACVRMFTV